MRRIHRSSLVVALIAALVAGCGTTRPTTPPAPSSASPDIGPSGAPASSAAPSPSSTAGATSTPSDPFLGAIVVTVSDRLRVRSAPEVSDASVKYDPLLPMGTELRVIGGPVSASGYVWYDVSPVAFALAG